MLQIPLAISIVASLTLAYGVGAAWAQAPLPWTIEHAAPGLRAASCPEGRAPAVFEPLSLAVTPVVPGPNEELAAQLPDGVRFAGGWHLASDAPHWGGLSGLAVEPGGDLLAVTDTGRFARIGLSAGAPDGTAGLAPMRFSNPLIRPGKLTADAEGLALADGLAFVAFERDFRVLAFDLDGCGTASTGVRVATPPRHFGKVRVRANAGPEALELRGDGTLWLTYEQPRTIPAQWEAAVGDGGRAVSAQVMADGTARLVDEGGAALQPDHRPVGTDSIILADGRPVSARLFRAYDAERGNRVRLELSRSDQPDIVIRLVPPIETDNFEGVALSSTPDGLRVYILSDDNFSKRQRTLLYAFDVRS